MRQQCTLYTLALGFALGAASTVLADGPTFTAIDYPGAASTQAAGINMRGDIVGIHTLPDKSTHGFLLTRDGNFTSINVPGAAYALANGIGPRGDLVGEFGG